MPPSAIFTTTISTFMLFDMLTVIKTVRGSGGGGGGVRALPPYTSAVEASKSLAPTRFASPEGDSRERRQHAQSLHTQS